MKPETCPLILLLLAGCRTAQPTVTDSPPAVTAWPPASIGVRIPETLRAYTLGAYADPDDPLIRHEGHVVHRVEGGPRWNWAPATRLAPMKEEPLLLAESNAEAEPTEEIEPPAARENPAPVVAPIGSAITSAPKPEREPALVPNADGVIDLTAPPAAGDKEVNPFAVRSLPLEAVREVTLHASGVIDGPNACAVVNGRVLQPGDPIESLAVVRIESDAVLLRHGEHLLRLPVGAKPVRIRLTL